MRSFCVSRGQRFASQSSAATPIAERIVNVYIVLGEELASHSCQGAEAGSAKLSKRNMPTSATIGFFSYLSRRFRSSQARQGHGYSPKILAT